MDNAAIEEAVAKVQITDILHRYSRGMDRMDRELTLSCWHPGGTDRHVPVFAGTAEGFIEWLWPVHAAMEVTRHVISNIIIEVEGDKAGSESYWTLALRLKAEDGIRYDLLAQGRYIDNFERIDGVWGIRHRESLGDWTRIEPINLAAGQPGAPQLIIPNNPEAKPAPWGRDHSDYSYQVLKRTYPRVPS